MSVTVTPAAQLVLFSGDSKLFRKYGNFYATRICRATHKPLPEPVTDFREALVLLYEGHNDKTRRHIDIGAKRPDGSRGPVIRIKFYTGGYTREELSGSYDFPVTPEVVEELRKFGILSPMTRYGIIDPSLLRLNERSSSVIMAEIARYEREQP